VRRGTALPGNRLRPVAEEFPIPEAFSVRTERRGDAAVVVPTGELDLATAPALEDALGRAFEDGSGRVVLDLRELEFIDSSGLRTLLTARRRAEEANAQFSLVAGHRALERTLEIAGVHKVFDWTPADELA
jgi:anti-anti-sigma factor